MNGNQIPESYLRQLYGEDHWLFAHDDVPEDVKRFVEEEL